MSSGEMTCCYCQATFPAPPGKPGTSFKCPHCRKWLARAAQTTSGGRKRSIVIRVTFAAVAIAVAVAAAVLPYTGWTIFGTDAEQLKKPDQAAQAAPGAFSAKPGAIVNTSSPRTSVARSRISVQKNQNGSPARAVVGLGMPFAAQGSTPVFGDRAGILQRELIRQAFLIAARDELGLVTRDDVLGERQNSQSPASEAHELQTISGPNGLIRIAILHTDKAASAPLFERDLTTKPAETTSSPGRPMIAEDLVGLAEQTENLARTQFPIVLRQIGLDGKPNATKTEGQVPEAIENRLSSLSFPEVFGALKDLHALVRSDAESPARLAALARGYALLGLLSEFQWHPAHKGYKARALLYAQRLVARQPHEPLALWHRAFTLALLGLPAKATADLKAADSLADSADKKVARPSWVELIAAFARCDDKALESTGGKDSRLAALLRLSVLEFPPLPNTTLTAASNVINLEPDCFRALDAICAFRAVSTLQVVMTLGPKALDDILPMKLKPSAGLPRAVQTFVKNPGSSVALVKLLEQSGASDEDAGELSWSALGHLIRETQFLLVYRRLVYMQAFGNSPSDEFWAQSRPIIAGHPLEPFLHAFSSSRPDGRGPVNFDFAHFNTLQLEPPCHELFGFGGTVLGGHSRAFRAAVERNSDHVVRDVSLQIRSALQTGGPPDPSSGRLLFALSPDSKFARSTMIEYDWDRAQPHIAEWEKEASESPALLGAIARHYEGMGKTQEAERLLLDYIKRWRDSWAYVALANIYGKKHDMSRWLEVLQRFLEEGGGPALEQAQVRVVLANYYMSQKQWEKAQPLALAAAATGAAFGMICAQTCAEGRKDWKEAEKWARATSEKYPQEAWDRWYTLCRKMSTGDVDAAFAFAGKWAMKSAEQRPQTEMLERVADFYLNSSQLEKALPILRAIRDSSPSISRCMLPWLVADLLEDRDQRDQYFKFIESGDEPGSSHIVTIWRLFHEAIDRDGGRSLDLPAIEGERARFHPSEQSLCDFIIGMFLQKHGRPLEAREYLQRAVDNPSISDSLKPVARDTIRKLDQDSNKPKVNASARAL